VDNGGASKFCGQILEFTGVVNGIDYLFPIFPRTKAQSAQRSLNYRKSLCVLRAFVRNIIYVISETMVLPRPAHLHTPRHALTLADITLYAKVQRQGQRTPRFKTHAQLANARAAA